MIKYRHIIFDIDGTLLDSEYAVLRGLQDTIAELQDRVVDTEELTFALGIPGAVALKKLGFGDTKAAGTLWNSYFSKYGHTIKLFDGIRELLPQLQAKGYELGIITSKNPQEFADDFGPQCINQYFNTVLCVTDSPRPKPYADPILTYLERTRTLPEEVIYIGDTVYDFQCTQNAGVDFGLALWGNASAENIKAKYFFRVPDEILVMD